MITCKNIKLRYKGSRNNALNDISLHIPQGKTIGIVGHNGAGKSTLIKVIMGLIEAEGSITYGFDKQDLYQHIHVQMQSSHFEKGMRVCDLIDFYLGVTQSTQSSSQLLSDYNLERYHKTKIEHLSGGERQRLAILLATIGHPKVIIFDEITTGLDSVARHQVWDLLKKMKRDMNLTIVLTSHFLDEVEYLADEVIILKEGSIVQSGTIQAIIDTTFENTRVLQCLYDRTFDFTALPFEYTKNDHKITLTINPEQEIEAFKALKAAGGFNIQHIQRGFEDAFLKLSGYTLSDQGDLIHETK